MQLLRAVPGVRVQELTGTPVTIKGQTLTPVARLISWSGWGGDAVSQGSGALLQLRPSAVRIAEEGVAEKTILIADPTTKLLWQLSGVGLLIAAACGVIMVVVWGMNKVEREKAYAE